MKNKTFKRLLCLSLSAALIVGEPATAFAAGDAPEKASLEDVTVEKDEKAEKIVNFSTLDTVSGIGYDTNSKAIYWNKVANATRYKLVVKDAAGVEVLNTTTSDLSYDWTTPGTYTVEVTAIDTADWYPAAANLTWDAFDALDESTYDDCESYLGADNNYYYNTYVYPKSAVPGTGAFTINPVAVQDETTGITAITSINLKEVGEDGIIFRIQVPKMMNSERIDIDYSNNQNFADDDQKKLFVATTFEANRGDNGFVDVRIPSSYFSMGETCYVRARVYNWNFMPATYDPNTWTYDQLEAARYSAYTNTVTYTIPKAKITGIAASVKGTSVTLAPNLENGDVTGYVFAKKVGKKWVTLAKQTEETYKDSGLTAKTTYQYRVRGYSYNQNTKKTTYTAWKTIKVKTWGSNLNLKANAVSSKKVKLTWKKVAGAQGYEIYRTDTSSYAGTKVESVGQEDFASYTLIKDIKKAKTTKYTDKKVTAGDSYSYIVRAYRVDGSNKTYVQDSAYVGLQAENAAAAFTVDQFYTSTGAKKVTWSKITGIKGYKVEKYNEVTDDWDAYKTLKSTATSITFPKVAAGSKSVEYRIRPYTADMVYDGVEVETAAKLASVTGVKAKATADGIQVSWKAVAGADYYRVYRTTDPDYVYDKTAKTYTYYGGVRVCEAAINTTNANPQNDGKEYMQAGTYKNYDITSTSVEDKTLTFQTMAYDPNTKQPIKLGTDIFGRDVYQTMTATYNWGPEKGVNYYYYVVACADAPNGSSQAGSCVSAGASKAAKAIYTTTTTTKVKKIKSAKSTKAGQVTLKYAKVKKATGYAVYRATSKKGTYVLAGRTNKTTFTDTNLKSGKTYYYKVASYSTTEAKAYIDSSLSKVKKVKVK